MACEGSSLLWRGDFDNAKQLLHALNRRIERTNERSEQRKIKKAANKSAKSNAESDSVNSKELPNLFYQQRQMQAQRARILSRLLLELDANYVSQLRRAPDVSAACIAEYGELKESCVLSFRDLQGALGAAQ